MDFELITLQVKHFFKANLGHFPPWVLVCIFILLPLFLFFIRKKAITKGLAFDRDMVLVFVGFGIFFAIMLNSRF